MVRELDNLGPVDETREIVRRHALPVITGSPGFRAVYVFGDEQERAATVALFDTRADALRSHEGFLQVLREKAAAVAPTPPRAATGRAIVFATGD